MYDDFTFRGRHISAFGANAFMGEGFATGAKISRNEYALPRGGSVIIGDASVGPITRQIEIVPWDDVEADGEWRRRVLSWLMAGRGDLVMDIDPDAVLTAQFDLESTGGTKVSPLGGLQVKATIQGVARRAHDAVLAGVTDGGVVTLTWQDDSPLPSPLTAVITPVSGTVTAVQIRVGDSILRLSSLSLTSARALTYRSEDGDVPSAVYEGSTLTFDHVQRWAQLRVSPGDTVEVTVSGAEATVELRARARWITG